MNRFRHIFLSAAAGLCLISAVAQAQGSAASVRAIEAQPLPNALKSFAQATGLQLVYVSEIATGLQSRGAQAGLSPQQSLQALLSGTGLTFEFVNERTVSIKQTAATADPAQKQTYERKHAQLLQMALAQTTVAQSSAAAAAQSETNRNAQQDQLKDATEVTVTGSRIRTLNTEVSAIPVFSITQEELERRGVNRLADIRWAVPQLGASVGFNDNLTNSGTSRAQQVGTSFNMRGLGGNSTLILVNGRRVPHTGQEAPGGAGGREDFSVDGLPISAIERIDILPQGAGAIYGSEAIAGVINIVLKQDYTGVETRVSYDTPFDTDVGQKTLSVTAGHRAGKMSSFLTASFEDQNGLASRDRWFTATADSRVYGAATSAFYLSQVASGRGSIASSFSPQNTGQPNLPGQTRNIVGIPTNSNGTTAANSAFTTTVPVQYDPNQYTNSIDPGQRLSLAANADYSLTDHVQLYGEVRWAKFENEYVAPPITMSTTLPAGYPGNPFAGSVVLRKVFYDLDPQQTKSTQKNLGFSAGLRGDFFETWRYDISATWARNIVADDEIRAGFDFTLLSAAINSTTNRPLLAYDSFNGSDPNAAGVLDALRPARDHEDTTDVYQYSAVADGSVWSGWAGDVRLAVGAEFGREDVEFWRSPGSPAFLLTQPFGRDSSAVFAELNLPLLSERQNIPFVHRFEVSAAVRSQDYSDIPGATIPTYRALFQPVSWLTLRASHAEGFKPVRLYDLLAPRSTFSTTRTAANNLRDNQRGGELVIGTFTYTSGGNSTLQPETSVSRNYGMVLDVPGALFEGLSFSVDYYEIDFTERSGGPSFQVLFDFFPERVTRANPTPADIAAGFPGVITTWDSSNINLAGVRTTGWDYRLNFQRSFDFGELMVSVSRTDSDPTFSQATPAAVPTSAFGHQPVRTSGSAFWRRASWDAGLSVNYQSVYPISGLTGVPYPMYIEYNPQLSYNFANDLRFSDGAQQWWARWLAGSKLSLTVINALNREPSAFDAAQGRIVLDPRLRRYIVSFSKSF